MDDLDLAALARRIDREDAERRTWLATPGALLAYALAYARAGHPVFPLRPGTKTPLTRHGFKDAVTDTDQVDAWWTANPEANIGLATGHAFDVIDVDPPGGWASLDELRRDGLVPATIAWALTARRGVHLYVPATGDGNAAGIRPGVDYRGIGGYVVAPPSRTAVGTWDWAQPLVEVGP